MNVSKVVSIADQLIFQSRSKHLNDLERSIVEGVCEGKKYKDIAEQKMPPCTEAHVSEVAANLWKAISEALGEDVKKSNFKSTIERHQGESALSNEFVQIGYLNLCSGITINNQPKDRNYYANSNSLTVTSRYLKNTPELVPMYGRKEELTLLKKWILEQQCQSIVIYGMTGIGKTTVARQLLEDISDKFETIVWQSLGCKRSLIEFIDRNLLPDLTIDKLPEAPLDLEARLSLVIECLRERRCLIILDDVEDIFAGGELAGNYIDKHQDYRKLFQRIRETNHQSCLIRLSNEKPNEIDTLEDEDRKIRTLSLVGLGEAGRDIFRAKGLIDEDRWEEVIEIYGGNAQYLKIVANSIEKSLSGKVSSVCNLEQIFLPAQLKSMLTHQLDRLSNLERKVIMAFANKSKSVSLFESIEGTKISLTDGCDATESLMRRGLIIATASSLESLTEIDDGVLFGLQSIIKQFIIQQFH